MYFASVKFVSNLLTNFSPPDKLLKRRVVGLCTYAFMYPSAYLYACSCFFIKDHLDTATIKPAVFIDIEKPSDMTLTIITTQITRLIMK